MRCRKRLYDDWALLHKSGAELILPFRRQTDPPGSVEGMLIAMWPFSGDEVWLRNLAVEVSGYE